MPIIKKQRGFAMVEVLVTAVILAIGISGLGMLLLRAIQGNQDSVQQSQGLWMVQDYAGRIRANAPGGRRGEGYEIEAGEYDCAAEEKLTKQCAELRTPAINGDGVLKEAELCLPDEMAAYDRWTTLCRLDVDGDHIYSNPSDFMINPVLTSKCTNNHASRSSNTSTGALDCVQYLVTLTWDTKLEKNYAATDDDAGPVRQNTYSVTVELN